MKAPKNRRVFIIGYDAITPLGKTFRETWDKAEKSESGIRKLTKFEVKSECIAVGEIPGWNPVELDFTDEKEIYNWNAGFIFLTMAVCKQALKNAGLELDDLTGPATSCLMASCINGHDSFRLASEHLANNSPLKVSPYLLPNLCGNLPSGKAGMLLGFKGPIFSPQGACASGNYSIGIGARMIRDGDCDFAIVGGADMPILPEIIHGFDNMNATIKVRSKDRAFNDIRTASRPFSADRKGFVLSEGAGALVLAAEEAVSAYGLTPKAEVMGIGWTSDAYHFTTPCPDTIIKCIRDAIEDAELSTEDIQYINAHGTSTYRGDKTEVECLRGVFGKKLGHIPVSANKSQIGHTLAGSASIEAALTIEGMHRSIILPTINNNPDPDFDDIDVVPDTPRKQKYEIALSNAFGFGGTNCCIILKGI
ncbi:MAG: beta-ketoacyl-[acyl-carrier-protein] synthase family protein [Spirochaetes bacterium]|nr:beta-ketoacyl-[acyl-carrier-protein] synthase family protein [Spirochaetota bacterium]